MSVSTVHTLRRVSEPTLEMEKTHLFCCNIDTALCGADITDSPITDDEADCEHCEKYDETELPCLECLDCPDCYHWEDREDWTLGLGIHD